jgi:class 3 adenylate cyclase
MDDQEGALGREEVVVREWLEALGATPEQVDAAERMHNQGGLASDLVLSRGAALSARDVALRAGVDADTVVAAYRDVGVSVPDPDARMFTEDDVSIFSQLAQAGEAGIVTGSELLRVIAGALERIAEAAVAVYVQGPEEQMLRRRASALEHVQRNTMATELIMQVGVGLAPLFRHHMRQAIGRQRVTQTGVSRRELARLAIGFVDLVGSTTLQGRLDPAELGAQVTRFETRAFDVIAAGGGRLVKFIGDEIMVAALDPVVGCRIVLDLVDAFTDDGTQPRGGLVFGEVLFRHGDYYGPVVNLAARLVDTAIPGEVLVDASVAEEAKDEGLSFEPAGRRQVKGFDAPLTVWSLASG